jgi:hypothetical protein
MNISIHLKKVARHVGDDNALQSKLLTYRNQLRDFTKCFENMREVSPVRIDSGWSGNGQGKKFFQCPEDLYTASSARKACTADARAFEFKRIESERLRAQELEQSFFV